MWIIGTIYPLLGLLIGIVAWGNNPAYMPMSLLILPAWFHAKNRFMAGLTVFLYFAAASRGLPIATKVYFRSNFALASVDWLLGLLIVSLPFFLLFFNNKKIRLAGLYVALVLIAIPPFGLVCWTYPLAGTGIWWPSGGWLALVVTLLLIPVFCLWPVSLALPIVLGLLLPHGSLATPAGWQAINTCFAGTAGKANCFNPLSIKDFENDFVKQVKTINVINNLSNKKIKIVLLPESSGGTWLTANPGLWRTRLSWPGTVLVSATVPAGRQYKDDVIFAVSRTTAARMIYRQRQPVPVSMWWPGRINSYRAHWYSNPVITFQGHRIAFFVCYEQFLTWPVLQSLWHNPELLCATSSVWWSAGTNIPAIQHNIMLSWSQLFSVPLLTAVNS